MFTPFLKITFSAAFALALFLPLTAPADDFKPEAGFISLFNGKDLTGWGYETGEKFDGKNESSDGRYKVGEGMIIVNSQDEARRAAAAPDVDRAAVWKGLCAAPGIPCSG